MVPPKKDVFSDLFNYAHGGLLKSSPSSSLHELSLKPLKAAQPKPTTFNENENANANSWTNLDVLSPNVVLSSAASKPLTPINNASQGKNTLGLEGLGVDDPFAVFAANSGSSLRKVEKTEDTSDPFEFFSVNLKADSKNTGYSASEFPSGERINQKDSENSRVDHALLDDEFTDAFSEPDTIEDSSGEAQRNSVSHLKAGSEEPERDHVLAALMAEGFPIDIANQAISQVGPDLEKCVRLIVMSSVDSGRSSPIQSSRNRTSNRSSQNRPSPNPSSHRREPLSSDLGEAFQDISQDLLKKATWLLDKSKKTVIKNINNFQNQRTRRDGNDMPAWISDQHKFKHQAIERRKDGSSYEDYGTDEDNIDTEEIRRIVQMQREKEIERQRQRLESLGRSKCPQQNTPTTENGDVAPDVQKTQRSQQKPVQTPSARIPRESTDSSRSSKPAPKPRPLALKNATPASLRATPEEDLLGLGSMGTPALSRAQQFKQKSQEETSYVSPARRRHATPSPVKRRSASCEPLNTFAQSDYDTHKASGGQSFSAGDYDKALASYTKCLHSLPEKHELRIIITSNLALTAIKIGNYPFALQNCDEGLGLVGDHFTDPEWCINDKNIKYWYVRLLTRKAESLEMLENFEASLDCYMTLVSKLAVNDKKTMDAKRRVNNIVNPPKPTQKSKPIKAGPGPVKPSPALASSKNLTQIKTRHMEEKLQEQRKFELHDIVHEKIHQWSTGKEANLRSLLMSLADILPQHLGFSFITAKKITINDLMLTKKVKINYMKVISNIHPDKLGGLELKDQMICQGVFVALNKAWDEFKKQNNIT